MGKTIIITERQLRDILEADFSYLDKMEGDFNEYNAHIETMTGGKLSDKTDAKPLTTDNFTKMLSKTYGSSTVMQQEPRRINCSKEDKKKILSENLPMGQGKTWMIPDELYTNLQTNHQAYQGDRNAAGWDRLNNLIKQRNVKYGEMKRLKNYFEQQGKKDQNAYNLLGGAKMEQWVQNSLKSYRGAIETDKANRSAMGQENVYQKAGGTKNSGNGKAHSKKNNGITYFE